MRKSDAYQVITDRILTLLEAGTVPWHKPWNAETGMPRNLASGKEYRGINVFMLGTQHYASPWWLTSTSARTVRAASGEARRPRPWSSGR
jgi:antirestriction protein ArdC